MESGFFFASCLFLLFCPFRSIPCSSSHKSFIKWELPPELSIHLSRVAAPTFPALLGWWKHLSGRQRTFVFCLPQQQKKINRASAENDASSGGHPPRPEGPALHAASGHLQKNSTRCRRRMSGQTPTWPTSSHWGETSVPPFANPRHISSLHKHTCAVPTFPTNP